MSSSRSSPAWLALFLVSALCLAQDRTPPLPTAATADPATTPVAKPLRVSRYRNPATGAHAFTTEAESQRRLPSAFVRQYVPESFTSSPFFYVYTEQYASTVPLYRFRSKDGSMVFAADPVERAAHLNRGLEEVEQPVFIYNRKVEGSSEVLRIFNPRDGDILYSTSPEEKDFYLKQGWTQLPSLGFAQSTSSSGTGILRDTTVKLEANDLLLVSRTSKRGQKIVFNAINSKIGALVPGTILYSEKNAVLPLGLVARVATISRAESGELEVETVRADLLEAFVEFHLYLENQQAYFLPPEPESEVAGSAGPSSRRGRGLRGANGSEYSAGQPTANRPTGLFAASQDGPEQIRSASLDIQPRIIEGTYNYFRRPSLQAFLRHEMSP